MYGAHQQKKYAAPIWSSEGEVAIDAQDVSVTDSTSVPIYHQSPYQRGFSPYDNNGGTTLAIAGPDFALAAGDTRVSTGFQILSRDQTKLHTLTSKCVLASAGCLTDMITLRKQLDARMKMYQFDHDKEMSSLAAAQLLSNTLYYRRFFPYYTFNILAGVDEDGRGAVFGYDAVGSYKRDEYGAMGSGQNFVVPLLDNLIGHKNRADARTELTREDAIAIAKECFVTAGERDIYTGDSVRITIIDSAGIHEEIFELKKD